MHCYELGSMLGNSRCAGVRPRLGGYESARLVRGRLLSAADFWTHSTMTSGRSRPPSSDSFACPAPLEED